MCSLKPFRVPQRINPSSTNSNPAIFNASFIDSIATETSQWGSKRILLVSSKTLAKTTDKITNLQTRLGDLIIDTKLGVGEHSPYSDVIDIAHRLHISRADTLICVGSSSYSDACKIGRMMHATLPPDFQAQDMEDLIDQDRGWNKWNVIKPSDVKLILCPTSLSASEWNPVASCTNGQKKKQHFGDWDFGEAELIIMDPVLASTAPERLWLSSGVRAIDHCVEIWCGKDKKADDEKEINSLMESGLRKLLKGLREYKEGKETMDREELLDGISECQQGSREAIMGLVQFKSKMGPSHAIGHQLGSVGGVMHGITSCIMLAPVLRSTKGWNPEAQAGVLRTFNEILGWEEKEAGDAVEKFVKMIGLPTTLAEVGITTDEQVDRIAEKTMTDVWGGGKRQIESKEEVIAILNLVRGERVRESEHL